MISFALEQRASRPRAPLLAPSRLRRLLGAHARRRGRDRRRHRRRRRVRSGISRRCRSIVEEAGGRFSDNAGAARIDGGARSRRTASCTTCCSTQCAPCSRDRRPPERPPRRSGRGRSCRARRRAGRCHCRACRPAGRSASRRRELRAPPAHRAARARSRAGAASGASRRAASASALRPSTPSRSICRDPRPALGESRPPGKRSREGDVGDGDPVEELGQPFVRPLGDRATPTSRRRGGRRRRRSRRAATLPHAGSPRQRQNTGRSETSSGSTIDAGCCDRRAAQTDLDHLREDLARLPASSKSLSSARGLDPASPARLGHRGRSSAPDAARGAPRAWRAPAAARRAAPRRGGSSCSCAARACPSAPLVRGAARASARSRRRRPSSRQWRRQERPSRWISSSATRGPQRARLVVREARPVALPGADDRVDELPLLLDLVLAREQRRVAEHRVEDQPLVGLGQPGPEGAAVEEVHVHGPDRHPRAGHLRADRERDALVGLHVDQQDVRPQPVAGDRLERRVRGALELDRDRRLAARRAACRRERRTACPPSASCRRRASRRRTSRSASPARRPSSSRYAGTSIALDEAGAVLAADDRLRPGRVHRTAAPSPSRCARSRR